ncbi:hypothetical protein ACFOW1_12510 [Parasediminibacterium paludis]|uniref:Uncharacterized protein n=1 Tax=Parasediminibacterium paludis TaxID=908966 RepID=A0ABV8Q0K0_9BACT
MLKLILKTKKTKNEYTNCNNSNGQDEELRVAFDATLKDCNWVLNTDVPDAYTKSVDPTLSENQIKKIIEEDINSAVEEAEWGEINHVSIISKHQPVYSKSTKLNS